MTEHEREPKEEKERKLCKKKEKKNTELRIELPRTIVFQVFHHAAMEKLK